MSRYFQHFLAVSALLVAGILSLAGCGKPFIEEKYSGKSLTEIAEGSGWASTGNLNENANIESAQIITNNDKAFQSKIDIIKDAQKTLDLMYFIYATDESSSVMTTELIKAAKNRHVKVRLLVDYLTNYKNLDHFRMMEREGAGNLEVRFYGRPTRNIVKDAVYMTMKCVDGITAEDCNQKKFAKVAELFAEDDKTGKPYSNMNVGLSGLFLSGLYAKNPQVMALAMQAGQDLTSVPASDKELTDKDKEGLKKLAKLLWEANTGNAVTRASSGIQLALAKMLYGEVVTPLIDGTYNVLPAGADGYYDGKQDWGFISDYVHMKIVAADGLVAQLGGRNVENSYHIDHPSLSNGESLTGKYIFMDTDMVVRLKQPDHEIRNAFSRVWDFEQMVATLADVTKHAPNDFLVSMEAIQDLAAQNECKTEHEAFADQQAELAQLTEERAIAVAKTVLTVRKKRLDNCLNKALPSYWGRADAVVSRTQRMDNAKKIMEENAGKYLKYYVQQSEYRTGADIFNLDPQAVNVCYLENTPFEKGSNSSLPDVPSSRVSPRLFGAINGQEHAHGKDIHAAWVQGLKQACEESQTKPGNEKTTVILHNAYFLLPTNLLSTVAEMVKRDECSRVNIQVLTNSLETTDLNVVNLVSKHSLKAFADYYKRVKAKNPNVGATVEYYEYDKTSGNEGPNRSLHTKVSVLGDNCMIVGSANADLRSYMMDANNGFLFCVDRKQAREDNTIPVIDTYKSFVENLMQTRATKTDIMAYADTSCEELLASDHNALRAIAAKYRAERWLDEEQMASLLAYFDSIVANAYDLSAKAIAKGEGSEAAEKFNSMFKGL